MKDVTEWMSYEEAKQRAEAKKAGKTLKKKKNKQSKGEKTDKAYVTVCGGIQPLPLLLPNEEEESL